MTFLTVTWVAASKQQCIETSLDTLYLDQVTLSRFTFMDAVTRHHCKHCRWPDNKNTASHLICSYDCLNSKVIINQLDIRDGLRDSTSCWHGCHGHRCCTNSCLATRANRWRRHVCRAWWGTFTCIAKEYVPRLSILTHDQNILSNSGTEML